MHPFSADTSSKKDDKAVLSLESSLSKRRQYKNFKTNRKCPFQLPNFLLAGLLERLFYTEIMVPNLVSGHSALPNTL